MYKKYIYKYLKCERWISDDGNDEKNDLMVLEVTESSKHAFVQVEQVLSDLGLGVFGGILELHARQLVQDAAHVITDSGPRDLVLGLRRGLDCSASGVVEADEVVQHEHALVERAVAIVCGVAVLLQEVVLDQLSHFQCDFVRFGKRVL